MAYTAAVITVSDKGARGERKDTSGPAVSSILTEAGYEVVYEKIVPDEEEEIRSELVSCADRKHISLVVTTGGTGFSRRDVTPEATRAVMEREAPGLSELMRMESMKITPHGCLSRGVCGIRGGTLIINLPGSEKAARENLGFIMKPLRHGLDMLMTAGSAGCAEELRGGSEAVSAGQNPGTSKEYETRGAGKVPSVDEWLREAKSDPDASKIGMYLVHNGVVRETARSAVRDGEEGTKAVTGMHFQYDADKVNEAVSLARTWEGVYYVRVWLNEGDLAVGDDIMQVLIGADIRPHAVAALEKLVGEIKTHCVVEQEMFGT